MSSAGRSCKLTDWMVAAVFFAVSVALRIPFRSQMAYHWDSAQFALAINHYDIRLSQPHAPGYFLYVMLGRLVNLYGGEPHTSLVLLSIVAGGLLAAVGFLLATAMFGRAIGIASAVILTTSPLCWFYSEIALTSIVDALLVVTTLCVCWKVIRSGGCWLDILWMSILFAAVAGVRQQSGAILAPVWCYALLKSSHAPRVKLACGVLLTGLLCLLWFVPMVHATGGLQEYISLLQSKSSFDAPKTIWGGGGMNALLTNVSVIGHACWVGLLLAAAISVGEFLYWVFGEHPEVKQQMYRTHAEQLCVLGLWIAPMVLFWMVMYVTTPGYVLCFFPGLAILSGMAVRRCADRLARFLARRKMAPDQRWRPIALLLALGLVAGTNIALFIWQPRYLNPVLANLPLTGVAVRQHDQQLAECFRAIRQSFRPEEVTIYHSDQFFYWGFRQFEYHLVEYRNVLLAPDTSLSHELQHKRWVGQWRQTTFIEPTDDLGTRSTLLIVPPGESVRLFQRYFDLSRAKLLAAPGMKLYVIPERL